MLNIAKEQPSSESTADMLPGLGLDQNFARTDTSGSYAMLSDALGSTLGLVNSRGALGTQYQYGPFGQTTTSGVSSTNPIQYTGREMDPTGLYFLRARYYNPIAQRLISPDPIGLSGGQVNFYAYVFNQPMNWADPLGLMAFPIGDPNDPTNGGDCNSPSCDRNFRPHPNIGHGAGRSPHGLKFNLPPLGSFLIPANVAQLAFMPSNESLDISLSPGPESYFIQDADFSTDLSTAISEGGLYPPYYAPAVAAPEEGGH